jgi:eukaryotic-like serine/threonine-protein kinase
MPTQWEGRVIDGRYAVEGVLGKGGMGFVLRARHRFTGARVAVKMLHPHVRLQGDLADRFLAEARAPAASATPASSRSPTPA